MGIRKQNVLGCIAFVIGVMLGSPTLYAADLQVSPTSIHLNPGDQAQQLWLSNSGTRPLQAQVRLFKWTQSNDADVLHPSEDFALSPAMVTVDPGQKQLVRVIRRAGIVPRDIAQEASYRILVDELPVEDASVEATGVQFVFRYSLPLFVAPKTDGKLSTSAVAWDYRMMPDGILLRVTNKGTRHMQIVGLSLIAGDQQLKVHKGLFGYVLANHTREWKIEADNTPITKIERIKATVNGEDVEHTISTWETAD